MIGREKGPTWASLRKGDVLLSHYHLHWCVIILLEDAPAQAPLDGRSGTLALRIFDDETHPEAIGAHRIRADDGEIDPKIWELIRVT